LVRNSPPTSHTGKQFKKKRKKNIKDGKPKWCQGSSSSVLWLTPPPHMSLCVCVCV
jgi:hypothetical protein